MAALVASQDGVGGVASTREAAKKRLSDSEARLRRFQAAIAAGVDATALVDAINEAQARRAAVQAELDGAPAPTALIEAGVYAMIDYLATSATRSTGPNRPSWRGCTRRYDWT